MFVPSFAKETPMPDQQPRYWKLPFVAAAVAAVADAVAARDAALSARDHARAARDQAEAALASAAAQAATLLTRRGAHHAALGIELY
nr:uncharacterized protein [uncultured bacterium]